MHTRVVINSFQENWRNFTEKGQCFWVLKDVLDFSRGINRDGHYIKGEQYVQKTWSCEEAQEKWDWYCAWSVDTGWQSGVTSRGGCRAMHGLYVD